MKVKKTVFGTRLIDLYGKDCEDRVIAGKRYWYWFGEQEKIYELTNEHWHLVEITYVRSGVAFYVISGYEEQIPEAFMMFGSFMIRELEPEILDPCKDLSHFGDILNSSCCFDDSRTKIVNFDNSKYEEMEETDLVSTYNELINCLNGLK